MRRNLLTTVALGAALAGCSSIPFIGREDRPAPPEPIRARTPAQIENLPAFDFAPFTADALRQHVTRLASDEFEGRAPSTRGEELSVDYISRAFALAGLEPAGQDANGQPSWFQDVPLRTATVTNIPVLSFTDADGPRLYSYGDQFMAWTKRAEQHIELTDSEMVFVGYGVVAPELGWNDYAGLDMTGKVAVILINDPDFETGDDRGFRGLAMTYYGRWTYKLEEAARQGAAGALIVHETGPAAYGWDVVQSSWSGAQHDVLSADGGASHVAVEGWIQESVARTLLARAGLDFDAEKHRAQRPDFTPTPLQQTMSITIETQIEVNHSRNVAGVLRGLTRPNETVVYSAHWDHLGRCPPVRGDDICNGAVDDSTGVAGLIDLARRFTNNGRLQRSIAFIAFTAEESGLLGSARYREQPLFAPADTVAAINMDMMGVDGPARDIVIVGSGQNELEHLVASAASEQYRSVSPDPYPERGRYFRGDHFNFARIGVPALYVTPGLDLYAGGEARGRALNEAFLRERYHEPDDEISPDWDYVGMIRDLMLLEQVGRDLANSELWPRWRRGSEFAPARVASRGAR